MYYVVVVYYLTFRTVRAPRGPAGVAKGGRELAQHAKHGCKSVSSARRTRHSCAMRSHVDRARLAASDEQEGARAVAARAAAAELGGHRGRQAPYRAARFEPARTRAPDEELTGQRSCRQLLL